MCDIKPVPADVVKTTKSQLACCNPQSEIYNLKFFAGVLAQLVERLNGIEEVTGSNPVGSKFLTMSYLQFKVTLVITGSYNSSVNVTGVEKAEEARLLCISVRRRTPSPPSRHANRGKGLSRALSGQFSAAENLCAGGTVIAARPVSGDQSAISSDTF